MRAFHWENFTALTRQFSPDQRRAASIAAVTHALHDGYTDLIYIMLPLWQAEFGLDYAALGILRSVFVGAMASMQIPAGLVAGRPRLRRSALAASARHLQLRRRHRQDDGAGDAVADAAGDGMAPGAG